MTLKYEKDKIHYVRSGGGGRCLLIGTPGVRNQMMMMLKWDGQHRVEKVACLCNCDVCASVQSSRPHIGWQILDGRY